MKLIAHNRCAWHCDVEGCCRISNDDLETRVSCLSLHLHGDMNGFIMKSITALVLSTTLVTCTLSVTDACASIRSKFIAQLCRDMSGLNQGRISASLASGSVSAMRTRWGSSKEFSAWGDGPTMSVCLAAAETEPHVMLCRNTGTSCLCGALLTSCKAVHRSQPDRTVHKVCTQIKRHLFRCPLQVRTLPAGAFQRIDRARRTSAAGTACT